NWHSRVSTREPSGTRNSNVSGTRRSGLAGRRRLPMHAQTLDPPRISVQHLEFETRWVGDYLAALWHTPGKAGDEPAQGAPPLLAASGAQTRSLMLFEHPDRGARIGDQPSVGAFDDARAVSHVVFILDFPDDLLDQILNRHQPVDPAE